MLRQNPHLFAELRVLGQKFVEQGPSVAELVQHRDDAGSSIPGTAAVLAEAKANRSVRDPPACSDDSTSEAVEGSVSALLMARQNKERRRQCPDDHYSGVAESEIDTR